MHSELAPNPSAVLPAAPDSEQTENADAYGTRLAPASSPGDHDDSNAALRIAEVTAGLAAIALATTWLVLRRKRSTL
jgi:hypothetical protein